MPYPSTAVPSNISPTTLSWEIWQKKLQKIKKKMKRAKEPMKKFCFITGNAGKLRELKASVGSELDVRNRKGEKNGFVVFTFACLGLVEEGGSGRAPGYARRNHSVGRSLFWR
jgi:hypothetical protein